MRSLFRAFLFLILFVLGTPALLAAIMYDGEGYDEMPSHLYTQDNDALEMLYQELSDSLDELESGANGDLELNVHEDIINVAIYQQLLETNPNYAPGDDCSSPEECYINHQPFDLSEEAEIRLVGVWVEFEEDVFISNVFIDVQLTSGIAYKTVIEAHFEIIDHPGEGKYTLQFEKVRIGNLPLSQSLINSILSFVDENIADLNLDEATAGLPIGTFDMDTFTYTVEKDEIIEMISETEDGEEPDDNTEMLQEMVSIVFEQGLLTFNIVDEEFVLAARISKFANEDEDAIDLPDELYELHAITGYDIDNNPIYGDYDPTLFDPETYLQNVFTDYIFNSALLGGGFEISDELFNKLIYSGAEGFEEMTRIEELELPDGSTREIEIGLQGLWFTIEDDAIYANALFKLDSTMSLMKLKATKIDEESDTQRLVFDFTDLTFGEDEGEATEDYVSVENLHVFESFLTELEDIKFGSIEETDQGIYLIISAAALTDVLTEGTEQNTVVIDGIGLIDGAIVLDVQPADQALADALGDIQDAINDVLEDETIINDLSAALNPDGTNEETQEVIDAVQDIQQTLANNETPDAEDVEELMDEFEDLTEEEQEQFLEEIVSNITDLEDELGNNIGQDIYDQFAALFGEDTLPDPEDVPNP